MKKEDTEIIKLVNKRKLTAKELEGILKSIENEPPKQRIAFEDYFGDKIKIGIMSDTHIGSNKFDEPLFKHMANTFKDEKVSRIYHCGDILEGMSGRHGQIYELNEIGFDNQITKATKLFKLIDVPMFGINGNHDDWYKKINNGGVNVSKELSNRVKNYHNLGDSEANIKLRNNITMKLFHANDGSAYAYSYKMQKLVESLSGGEKPDILIEGHYHKAMYVFIRNIHALEAGTICGQTEWMRGKKISAHKGFWILDIEMNDGGIGKMQPTFYPGYK